MSQALHEQLRHHLSGHYRAMRPYVTDRPRAWDHLLIWSLQGRVHARIDGVDVRADSGDLVVFEPGTALRYSPEQADDWEWMWVHFGGTAAAALAGAIGGPVVPFGVDEQVRARFLELVSASAASASAVRLDSCLYSLLGLVIDRLQRPGSRYADRTDLSRVYEFVNARLAEPLTLNDLVRHTGFSTSHLTRLFRDQVGESPMRYVTRMRLTRAATLLSDSDLTVAEIAHAVGFPDPYHFSRRFKQAMGQSPAHYRRGSTE